MRNSISFGAFLLIALQGCDLTEAKRMDLGRQKVESIGPQVLGVSFLGRQTVAIDSLINLTPYAAAIWSISLGDSGTTFQGLSWKIRGTFQGATFFLLEEQLNPYASVPWVPTWDSLPVPGEWMRHPDQLKMDLEASDGERWILPNTFLQNFNELTWDSGFALSPARSGDTLRLKVQVARGSPGRSDSMPVFSVYRGLRNVGDYVRYLKPGDTATLSWVVTAVAGDSLDLDLGWGNLGESHTYTGRVSR